LPSSPSSHVIAASQTTTTVAPSCHVTHRHRRPFLPRHPPPLSPPPVAPTAVTLFCHVTHHRRRMPCRPRYHHHPPRGRPRHRPLLAGRIPRGTMSSGVVEGRGGLPSPRRYFIFLFEALRAACAIAPPLPPGISFIIQFNFFSLLLSTACTGCIFFLLSLSCYINERPPLYVLYY
jgi:hypothetical protein